MYKYLPISTQIQEMMVMFKSLPTNTVVVNKYGKLVDVNLPALRFLKAKSIDDFILKKWGALNRTLPLMKIIHQLKRGIIIQNKNVLINSPDFTSINLCFSSTMLSGSEDIFIFQFFEIFKFDMSDQEYLSDSACEAIRNLSIIKECKHSINNLLMDNTVRTHEHQYSVDEKMIQLFSEKYRRLTPYQEIICALLASGMAISDIAKVTNKMVSSVDGTVRRITAKLNLESPQELYRELQSKQTYFAIPK
jgi:DNA-binding CsgD family transcriptional regulator